MKLLFVSIILYIDFTSAINIYWRDYNGTIPHDAVIVNKLHIAQISGRNGILPGTFYPESKTAISMEHDSKTVATQFIKIMCTPEPTTLVWEYVNTEDLRGPKLSNLILGGHEDGFPLYIGKVFNENEWKVGKVHPSSNRSKGLHLWTRRGCCHYTQDFLVLKHRAIGHISEL